MSLDSILGLIQTALELGCIYALVALALFLSYRILDIAEKKSKSTPAWRREAAEAAPADSAS